MRLRLWREVSASRIRRIIRITRISLMLYGYANLIEKHIEITYKKSGFTREIRNSEIARFHPQEVTIRDVNVNVKSIQYIE